METTSLPSLLFRAPKHFQAISLGSGSCAGFGLARAPAAVPPPVGETFRRCHAMKAIGVRSSYPVLSLKSNCSSWMGFPCHEGKGSCPEMFALHPHGTLVCLREVSPSRLGALNTLLLSSLSRSAAASAWRSALLPSARGCSARETTAQPVGPASPAAVPSRGPSGPSAQPPRPPGSWAA